MIAPPYIPPRFYDLRADRVAVAPKVRVRGGGPVWRDPKTVDSIVLHQTAVVYQLPAKKSLRDAAIKAAGGDPELALAKRASKVACHAMAFRGGFYVAATPLRWYVNHGNGLNARSLGFETDGLYSGLDDDPSTTPKREDLDTTWGRREPSILTAQIVETAIAGLTWLVTAARAEGMPIRYLFAHRQSSPNRRPDPGEGPWREIGIEAAKRLGLEVLPDLVVTGGRPLPRSWDPRATAGY